MTLPRSRNCTVEAGYVCPYKLGKTSSCYVPVLPVVTFALDSQGPFLEGTNASITVLRTGDNTTAISVKYKCGSSTAYSTQIANDICAAAADFESVSGVLHFDEGVVKQIITVSQTPSQTRIQARKSKKFRRSAVLERCCKKVAEHRPSAILFRYSRSH